MSLTERLKPLFGKNMVLGGHPAVKTHFNGKAVHLHFFDWDKVSEDVKEEICEQAGQDDYIVFAVANAEDGSSIEDMVEEGNDGYLMYSDEDEETIYLGNGEMDTFTTEVESFFSGLKAAPDDDEDDD